MGYVLWRAITSHCVRCHSSNSHQISTYFSLEMGPEIMYLQHADNVNPTEQKDAEEDSYVTAHLFSRGLGSEPYVQ